MEPTGKKFKKGNLCIRIADSFVVQGQDSATEQQQKLTQHFKTTILPIKLF